MKVIINNCPILFFYNETAVIILQTDASDYGIGGYLFQIIDGKHQPIMFISKAFTRAQLRWSPFEKEAYAIIYCVKKLDYLPRDVKFTLQTDHRNLLFLKENSDAKVVRWNMVLSEFNYTLEHIPGNTNIVADMMSRAPHNPIPEIRKELEENTSLTVKQRANFFAIIHNIDIPNDRYRILEMFHNAQVGHHGYERTITMLQQQGHEWIYMRSHVKKFLRECPVCQKMNPSIPENSAIRFTTAAYEPFARLSMDSLGPLPETETGYKFILLIIDCFTRTMELYPCRTTDAQEASQHLIAFISRYGTPEEIVSDRGSQFVNATIAATLKLLKVDHVLTLANSKQETAIVERANKEVLRLLIPLVYESKLDNNWIQFLPLIHRIYMMQPHRSTGVAPATLLYGGMVHLERGMFPAKQAKESTTASSNSPQPRESTWIEQLLAKQLEMLTIAQRYQLELDAENLATRTEKSENITEFPIGSFVLALYKDQHSFGKGRPPNKLMPIKRGPFRVISHQGNTYKVQSLAHDNIMEIHVKELLPFIYDANHVDPFTVSLGDEKEFVVENIIGHELRPNSKPGVKRPELFLHIKWEGYGDELYEN